MFNTPFEVEPSEPWNELRNNLGNDLNNELFEASPFIALNKSCTLNDLLQPGFPTINSGTLELTQTNKVKRFSSKALFFAIPIFISILLEINCCSLWAISSKFSPNILFIIDAKSCLSFLFERRI